MPSAPEQAAAPADRARCQIAQIDPEHILDPNAGPRLGEALDFGGKRLLTCREVRRVDSASRDTSEDPRHDVRELACEQSKKADLIRGSGTAAAQHKRKV